MKCLYKIVEISYSKKYGENGGLPKVGEKYDNRRGQLVEIDFDQYKVGDMVVFSQDCRPFLYTTPLVQIIPSFDGITTILITKNSIYELEKVGAYNIYKNCVKNEGICPVCGGKMLGRNEPFAEKLCCDTCDYEYYL